jgi:hypothetical protein
MGNALSEEEETQLLEEAYSMSLESPEADKVLNAGTSAPNCQPKKTMREQREDQEDPDGDKRLSEKHRRNSSNPEHDGERRKRQHTEQQAMTAAQQQKKLSYVQMAKLGYQELVNAIIRPPRADYKVRGGFTKACIGVRTKDSFNGWLTVYCFLSLLSCTVYPCVTYLDGSIGPSRVYLLWKTIYSDRLYAAHKAGL